MKRNPHEKNYLALISITITTIVMLLTIGWSAFYSELNIDAYVSIRVKKDTRITNFSYVSQNNNTKSKYEDYNTNYATADAIFPNANSTITYEISFLSQKCKSSDIISTYHKNITTKEGG